MVTTVEEAIKFDKLSVEARELADFFTNTYMEEMLVRAVESDNLELLEIAVKEANYQQQMIFEAGEPL